MCRLIRSLTLRFPKFQFPLIQIPLTQIPLRLFQAS
jgi:hypothetical protein